MCATTSRLPLTSLFCCLRTTRGQAVHCHGVPKRPGGLRSSDPPTPLQVVSFLSFTISIFFPSRSSRFFFCPSTSDNNDDTNNSIMS
ncbi:hypothetical protein CH063_05813 [Colletotrichum higginsianum]|uniref:Secreted protein n=1 Tax=Colletotrichum higginsianum (strain IMI 349063) TaxID=759273 RepID=H1V0B7_COLHI|nr:hypothetical protein CH063_05813 [Colletotrichum higginsianum]